MSSGRKQRQSRAEQSRAGQREEEEDKKMGHKKMKKTGRLSKVVLGARDDFVLQFA